MSSSTCDPSTPFGPPSKLTDLGRGGVLSDDELTFVFANTTTTASNVAYAMRASTSDPLGPPSLITNYTSFAEGAPGGFAFRGNDTLYLSLESSTSSDFYLWEAHRLGMPPVRTAPKFEAMTMLDGTVNSQHKQVSPFWSAGDQTLYFTGGDGWSAGLFKTVWDGQQFQPAEPVTDPALTMSLGLVGFTSDGLTAYFVDQNESPPPSPSPPPPTVTLSYSTRATTSDPFTTIGNVPNLDASQMTPTWISGDGCRLVVWSLQATATYVLRRQK